MAQSLESPSASSTLSDLCDDFPVLRPLTADDWPLVYAEIWLPIVRAGGTYLYPPETTAGQAWDLWYPPEPGRAWVWEQDREILATASLRPNQPGAGAHIANAAFMVAPRSKGQGVGRALAEFVLAEAAALGFRGMQFNAVIATNTAAIRLWDSLGFTILGRVPNGYRGETTADLLIMYRDL